MSFSNPPRVRVPANARPGDVVTIRAMVSHPMESGFRAGPGGIRIPRLIVRRFECRFDGDFVLAVDLEPAVAANPYLEFDVVVTRSGTFHFLWVEDGGATAEAEAAIVVA